MCSVFSATKKKMALLFQYFRRGRSYRLESSLYREIRKKSEVVNISFNVGAVRSQQLKGNECEADDPFSSDFQAFPLSCISNMSLQSILAKKLGIWLDFKC